MTSAPEKLDSVGAALEEIERRDNLDDVKVEAQLTQYACELDALDVSDGLRERRRALLRRIEAISAAIASVKRADVKRTDVKRADVKRADVKRVDEKRANDLREGSKKSKKSKKKKSKKKKKRKKADSDSSSDSDSDSSSSSSSSSSSESSGERKSRARKKRAKKTQKKAQKREKKLRKRLRDDAAVTDVDEAELAEARLVWSGAPTGRGGGVVKLRAADDAGGVPGAARPKGAADPEELAPKEVGRAGKLQAKKATRSLNMAYASNEEQGSMAVYGFSHGDDDDPFARKRARLAKSNAKVQALMDTYRRERNL